MIRSAGLALPLLFVGPATGPETVLSSYTAATVGLAQASSLSAFRMPGIAKPQVSTSKCAAIPTIKLTASSTAVKGLCVANGKILVNGSRASGFVMSDIVAKSYGPLMRGTNVPGLQVMRISAIGARADATLGLGLVNVSDGIGHAVFHDLVWIGDTASPAINSDDAWGAITLKGKDANDVGTFEIRNFDFQNLIMASGKYYANVDGISTEKGYSGTIADGRVINASDACLDIKGDVHVDNVYLSGCREGLKIWSSQNHGLVQLGTNRFVGIIGKGSETATRRINIDVLIASGDPKIPLFRAEDGRVDLHIGRLVAKSGQVLKASGTYSGSQVIIDQTVYN